jgi:hypothetical protein
MPRSPGPAPQVSIVLPCAGFGTRFGSPYAKELHCVAPGVTVLDRSLQAAVDLVEGGWDVRLVVVFRTHKLDTVSYLARYAQTFQTVFVYQDESVEAGLDGAIRSALPLTRGPVALVLPDIVVSGPGSSGCLLDAVERTSETGWSVVAAEERDPEALRQGGALRLAERDGVTTVVAAAEKPADPAGFNAGWGMIAVAEEQAHRLPAVTKRDAESPLPGAVAVMVGEIINYNTVTG